MPRNGRRNSFPSYSRFRQNRYRCVFARSGCAASTNRANKSLRPLYGLHATGANVIVYYLAFLVDVRNLLYVCLKGSSRPSLGMAYVVAGSLTLSAYAAYSRHIIYLHKKWLITEKMGVKYKPFRKTAI